MNTWQNFNWTEDKGMTDHIWRPRNHRLRQFAIIWTLFTLCLAIRCCWPNVRIVPAALLSLASILGVVAWFRPQIIRPVYVSWMVAAFPIGWMISHLLLAILFFGLLTPLALLLRISGRDALGLKWQCKTASYWTRKDACIAKYRYLQQF
jgi:saxitoxin biosynthesis operon SxtJ-like protein